MQFVLESQFMFLSSTLLLRTVHSTVFGLVGVAKLPQNAKTNFN